MKQWFSTALIFGTLLLCAAESPFVNGGFENDLADSWRLAKINCTATATNAAATPCEGEKALKLSVTEFKAPYCAMLNTAKISGDELTGKAISVAYRGKKEAMLLVRYRYLNNGKKDYRYDIATLAPAAAWRHYSWPLNPPAGSDEACVELRAMAAGDYEFDDLKVIPASEAKIVLNGDFEEEFLGTWRFVNHSTNQRDSAIISRDEINPASGTRSLKMELKEDVLPMAEVLQTIRISSTDAFKGKAISFAFRGSRQTMAVVDFKTVKAGKTEHTYTFCKLPGDMTWKRFSFPLNVPDNAVSVTVELRATSRGSYWFDEVAFSEIQK